MLFGAAPIIGLIVFLCAGILVWQNWDAIQAAFGFGYNAVNAANNVQCELCNTIADLGAVPVCGGLFLIGFVVLLFVGRDKGRK